jgi:hypothetical protein
MEGLLDYLDRVEQIVRPSDLALPFMSRRATKDIFCLTQFQGNHKKINLSQKALAIISRLLMTWKVRGIAALE